MRFKISLKCKNFAKLTAEGVISPKHGPENIFLDICAKNKLDATFCKSCLLQ